MPTGAYRALLTRRTARRAAGRRVARSASTGRDFEIYENEVTFMPVPVPTADTRWRCTLCGNLTRFDVTRSSKVVEYVHLDLAGEPKVEEREVLSETLESVRCRWCNAVDQIELVDRPATGAGNDEGNERG
ncbi:hypothetical protein GCM10012280_07630 [Wenjunlia tyrosinilytica]|uniref:Uncharacterized protein n=2 Tax=Wenjunlia tyrosinilytica TaxID=1544741 RepID=A0A917ZFW6_9ACTN|nr:hypothetical protein GCM10012280_07630 [Wenjunlia tyrosinilytica]